MMKMNNKFYIFDEWRKERGKVQQIKEGWKAIKKGGVIFLFVAIFFILLNSFIIVDVYATNAVYNMLRGKLSLDYKESRKLPILFEVSDSNQYRYHISFHSPYLKVFLVDENGNPLPEVFTSGDVSTTTLITGNNKVRRVHIVYLLFKYYLPSRGEKVKVYVEITPLFSQFNGRYSSHVSSSISYTLTVYLNPYIPPVNSYGGGESSSEYTVNSINWTPPSSTLNYLSNDIKGGGSEYSENGSDEIDSGGISNISERYEESYSYSGGENINKSNESIHDSSFSHFSKDAFFSSNTSRQGGGEAKAITGKFTSSSSYSFTLLLILLAIIGLVVIYRKA